MKKRHLISVLIVMLAFYNVNAQKVEEITHRKIYIHHNDSSIECSVLLSNKRTKANIRTSYYWYDKDKILMNQGGFGDKLLDGLYQVVTKNRQLITEGHFKIGAKSGVWKRWNEQGLLLDVYHWNKGQTNGEYQLFDKGELIEQGQYKNGLLHGKQLIYQKDTTIINKYKEGKLVLPKEKKEPVLKEGKEKESKKKIPKEKEQEGVVKDHKKKSKKEND